MGALARIFGLENQEKQLVNDENPNVARARLLVDKGEKLKEKIKKLEWNLSILEYGKRNPDKVDLIIRHPEMHNTYGHGNYEIEEPYRYDMPALYFNNVIDVMMQEMERELREAKYAYEHL